MTVDVPSAAAPTEFAAGEAEGLPVMEEDEEVSDSQPDDFLRAVDSGAMGRASVVQSHGLRWGDHLANASRLVAFPVGVLLEHWMETLVLGVGARILNSVRNCRRGAWDPPCPNASNGISMAAPRGAARPGIVYLWPDMPCMQCGCPWWSGNGWDVPCGRCGWTEARAMYMQGGIDEPGNRERHERFVTMIKERGRTPKWDPRTAERRVRMLPDHTLPTVVEEPEGTDAANADVAEADVAAADVADAHVADADVAAADAAAGRRRHPWDPPSREAAPRSVMVAPAGAAVPGTCFLWPAWPCMHCGSPWWSGNGMAARCSRCGLACADVPPALAADTERQRAFASSIREGRTPQWPATSAEGGPAARATSAPAAATSAPYGAPAAPAAADPAGAECATPSRSETPAGLRRAFDERGAMLDEREAALDARERELRRREEALRLDARAHELSMREAGLLLDARECELRRREAELRLRA